ncbi:DUF5691 domain-containing protein [Pseudanabaena sp. FACHB-2040]|uniref:DUF5691 domain-containing protein n=1 Tax=Pseudanabaena sp. FACHB-2040 TaxID=2692859 RepID=UPI001685FC96|nr:DUF5691 domain-containing protein [Pseudanabaena sp. FACHB-2040]MBD2256895.1 hypothetical protein [Pseudanabaena sp. FACHB-2040]
MGWQADSPWQAVVSAALLGTERQPFTSPTAPGKLGQLLAQLTSHAPESALLTAAAALSLHQRAGWFPENYSGSAPAPCSLDDLPRCSTRAGRFLQQMLQRQYSPVLPEWLGLATQLGQRVPDIYLPQLLNLGQQQRDLRSLILPVLGQRGRWLAAQNLDWSYAVEVATEADWETGSQAARLLYLKELRSQDPERARELLAATWSHEPASDRTQFLETFRTGLSLADEPFLEEALTDRSKEVRRTAADLLASLPESRLCQRLAEQVQQHIFLNPTQVPTLTVQLPDSLNPALIHDGIEPKPSQFVATQLGEKAWWLLQMIGATPLSFWSETWKIPPAEIVGHAKDHEWEAVLLEGWALAAKRQQNADWVQALLGIWLAEGVVRTPVLPDVRLDSLLNILSFNQQSAVLVDLLKSGPGKVNDFLTLSLLRSRDGWSLKLAETVLDHLEDYLSHQNPAMNQAWELHAALKEFARVIPIGLLPRAVQLQEGLPPDSPWAASVREFLALLRFRQKMVQAFEVTDSG